MSSDRDSHVFPCVYCGMTLRASESARNVKCPQCLQVFCTPRFPVDCLQEIEGEGAYQLELRKLVSWTHKRDGFRTAAAAFVHREPGNPNDPNAVCVKIANHLVGYIPKENSSLLQRAMRQKLIPEMFWAPALIYGGFQLKEGTFEPYSVWICDDTLESMIVKSLPELRPLEPSSLASVQAENDVGLIKTKLPRRKKSPVGVFLCVVGLLTLLCCAILAASRLQVVVEKFILGVGGG